jgi:hypothetical protein
MGEDQSRRIGRNDGCEPLEATGFRVACLELLEQWDEVGEEDEPVDDQYAFEFFQNHYGSMQVNAAEAALRFLSLMDALEEAPLSQHLTDVDNDPLGLHPAVFESAALAPMSEEGLLDTCWMTRDLASRLLQISTLEGLLASLE